MTDGAELKIFLKVIFPEDFVHIVTEYVKYKSIILYKNIISVQNLFYGRRKLLNSVSTIIECIELHYSIED